MKRTTAILAVMLVVLGLQSAEAQYRDQIRITGSSTLYPFSTSVAEEFGRMTSFDAPVVEAIGSGGGLKSFCSGLGINTPDIANASRRMKASEFDLCQAPGVAELIEIKIGYDGIVLANTKEAARLSLSLQDLYQALAAQLPEGIDADGMPNMVDNPHKLWRDIRSDLPATPISVIGPPPTSGTRDAFNELAMMGGCLKLAAMRSLGRNDPDQQRRLCQAIRQDGVFVEGGENDNLIVQKLQANWDTVGIFGFSFLDQNSDVLQPVMIQSSRGAPVLPSFDSIADGDYPIFRSLFFYVKKAHIGVIPGIPDYLDAFTSDAAWGDFGYLIDRGLIPLTENERDLYRDRAKRLVTMARPS